MKILHIIVKPRREHSNTLSISAEFLEGLTTGRPWTWAIMEPDRAAHRAVSGGRGPTHHQSGTTIGDVVLLVLGGQMVCITSRGSNYSSGVARSLNSRSPTCAPFSGSWNLRDQIRRRRADGREYAAARAFFRERQIGDTLRPLDWRSSTVRASAAGSRIPARPTGLAVQRGDPSLPVRRPTVDHHSGN